MFLFLFFLVVVLFYFFDVDGMQSKKGDPLKQNIPVICSPHTTYDPAVHLLWRGLDSHFLPARWSANRPCSMNAMSQADMCRYVQNLNFQLRSCSIFSVYELLSLKVETMWPDATKICFEFLFLCLRLNNTSVVIYNFTVRKYFSLVY